MALGAQGEPARLDRSKLARSWTLYRNVYFTSSRSGYAAWAFDRMWQQRYWRSGTATPPVMQMPLADAIAQLAEATADASTRLPVDLLRPAQ